jgi:hypothetical protein
MHRGRGMLESESRPVGTTLGSMLARCIGRDPYDKSRMAVIAQWSMAYRLSHSLKSIL